MKTGNWSTECAQFRLDSSFAQKLRSPVGSGRDLEKEPDGDPEGVYVLSTIGEGKKYSAIANRPKMTRTKQEERPPLLLSSSSSLPSP